MYKRFDFHDSQIVQASWQANPTGVNLFWKLLFSGKKFLT